jgi:hypothetical protein
MPAMRRTTLALVSLTALLHVSSSALAEGEADRGQARELGQQAIAAADSGDWAKSEDLFRRAAELYPAPTLLLGLARARSHLGKFVEAWEDYHRIVVEGLPANPTPAARQALDDATKEMASVEGKRARVAITVKGPDRPTVLLDGAPLSVAALGANRPVNPGTHKVHAEAAGYKSADATFTVTEGGSATQTLEMERDTSTSPQSSATQPSSPSDATPPTPAAGTTAAASTPPAPSSGGTMKTIGLVGIGVGGAGIIVGAITGAIAMGKRGSISSSTCATSAGCSQSDLTSYQSSLNDFHTMGTVSTVSFIAGAVLAGGGVVLFLTAPKGQSAEGSGAAWIAPYVGPDGAGAVAQGRF